jgi:predicted ArsR family transcriptional regulator
MAVLNHIKRLENQGMVERSLVKASVGRPYYVFQVKDISKEKMTSSSEWLLDGLLEYLEKTNRGEIAKSFLNDRYKQIRIDYEKRLNTLAGQRKVEGLTRIREEENYFPELRRQGKDSYELLEYNCPIFKISRRFGIACTLETKLFSSVLDMDVSSTHRQVDGSDVCRFLITKKSA